jgi:hypothetical protein
MACIYVFNLIDRQFPRLNAEWAGAIVRCPPKTGSALALALLHENKLLLKLRVEVCVCKAIGAS